LRFYGIEVIAPHRRNRRDSTQDGRRLKRYRRRWKIERLFAWLQNFRRLVVRYERHAENFLGMLQLASSLILLRAFMRWVLVKPRASVRLLFRYRVGYLVESFRRTGRRVAPSALDSASFRPTAL